jgi:RimJ/RimL family protein N-acetyltransferase
MFIRDAYALSTAMTIGPTLTTARLILRPPVLDDLPAWMEFQADDEGMRYLGGVATANTSWRLMAAMAGSWSLMGFSMFSVVERDTGKWVGRLGPWMPEGWPGHEVGWGILRRCWGKGYATEGAEAAMDWAFEHLGWTDIIHCIDPRNTASQIVAKHLGSTLRGPVFLPEPMQAVPVEAWGQTREQWRSRRTERQSR